MDDQQAQPTEAQPADVVDAAASDAAQETESGFMNRLIRGVRGIVGRDDGASEPAAEPQDATPPTTDQASPPPAPVDFTQTPEFQKAVQSRSDQLLARQQREWAVAEADNGNLLPIRTMAEKGDSWAKQQLSVRGDIWARGEIAAKEDLERQQRENDPVPIVATGLDQAVFWPVMGALPKEEEERIVRAGVNGYDGRHRAVTEAIGLVKKYAAEEALAKALDDPAYAAKAVQSETFRAAVLSHPVLGKQLLARHRGDREEPDLLPGSGPGRGGERENDVMNDSLRDLWRGAEDRGDTERAAGAGAANGRAAHRDLLDDD